MSIVNLNNIICQVTFKTPERLLKNKVHWTLGPQPTHVISGRSVWVFSVRSFRLLPQFWRFYSIFIPKSILHQYLCSSCSYLSSGDFLLKVSRHWSPQGNVSECCILSCWHSGIILKLVLGISCWVRWGVEVCECVC